MSIVNQLSNSNRMRDRLVNNRNGFTYIANITVLSFALLMFLAVDDPIHQFRYLCFMCLGLGFFASSFYMYWIREVPLSESAVKYDKAYKEAVMGKEALEQMLKNEEDKSKKTVSKDWKAWLGEGTFYVHGMVYMLVRIAVNVTMTMQPFYLDKVTGFSPTPEDQTPFPLAAVPLLSYVFSMIFSIFFQQKMTRYLRNRMYPMFVSIIIISVSSIPLAFLENNGGRYVVYPLAAFQGVGIAIMMNTATSLISDVIGNDSENSAFVYGCYSLFDKFANGALLYWMIASYADDPYALKYIISIVPTICSIFAFILTYIGNKYFSHKLAKITGIRQK